MSFSSRIQPSCDSITGRTHLWFSENLHPRHAPSPLIARIFLVAIMAFTTAIDAACWVGMTITVYPAFRLGLKHFANLISIVTFPIFAIKFLFNDPTNVNHHRGFFNPVLPGHRHGPPPVALVALPFGLPPGLQIPIQRPRSELMIHEERIKKDPMLFSSLEGALEKSVKEMEAGQRNVNARDMRGRTMLMVSAFEATSDLMKRVLAQTPDTHLRDNNGRNILFYAAMRHSAEKLQLLANRELDPDCTDNEHRTAMSTLLLGISVSRESDGKSIKSTLIIENHESGDTWTIPTAKQLMTMDVPLDYRHLDELAQFFTRTVITDAAEVRQRKNANNTRREITILPSPNPFTGMFFPRFGDPDRMTKELWVHEAEILLKDLRYDSESIYGTVHRLISLRGKLGEAHREVVGERATAIATRVWDDQTTDLHKSVFRIVVEYLIGPMRPTNIPIPTYQ